MNDPWQDALQRVCLSEDELWEWVRAFLGLEVPRRAVCRGHCAPFDYLRTAYFEPARDQVVWAPRGGGKTRLGAAATLLDLLHKPGIQVRILGGSMEQSLKMWEHLAPDLERVGAQQLDGALRGRSVALLNRSRAGVIAQSQRAVRGMRIHKLRCDEVELFDPEVWEAAQLTVRSEVLAGGGDAGDDADLGSAIPGDAWARPQRTDVRGTVEALSTFHKPWGLMSKVLERAAARRATRLTHWCILEVLERCPPERQCASCPLWDDCGGIAKEKCDGFYRIDDAIATKQRVSADCWSAEMLCRRPTQKGRVFPAFSRDVHVMQEGSSHGLNSGPGALNAPAELSWAIDFGFKAPLVCLWVMSGPDGQVQVVDEYVQTERTLAENLVAMESRRWGRPAWLGCDPAGAARNEQTAQSNISLLRRRGYLVRSRASHIADGIELIRAALQPASGAPKLFVSAKCPHLIRALQGYHYAPGKDSGELPEKDGEHDHLIDALRYFFINRGRGKAYGGKGY